jgi:hypothetical protein
MVHLQKFHERYARDGLFVFAIAMLPGREKDRKSTAERGVSYSVFFGYGSDLGKRYAYG